MAIHALERPEAEEESEDSEVAMPEALATYYEQHVSGDTRHICERERARIVVGRREQHRKEAWHFREIRKALLRDHAYLTDWCAAAGENYGEVANLIEGLEKAERKAQKARSEKRSNRGNNSTPKPEPELEPEPNPDPEPTPDPNPKPKPKPEASVKREVWMTEGEAKWVDAVVGRVKDDQGYDNDSQAWVYVAKWYHEHVELAGAEPAEEEAGIQ